MTVNTPLELWRRATPSYESIPDDEHDPRISEFSHHRRYCSWRYVGGLLILPLLLVGFVCLGFFAQWGSYLTVDRAHQETVVPTLLSVIYPENRTHIYALRNPVYNELQEAEIISVKDSPWKDVELPELWLDRTEILPGGSLTVTWTVGRDTDTGNIFLQDNVDVIALYCEESDSFLEAATIEQIKATSKFYGGDDQDSWYIPSFPNLRQDHCHFRLYASLSKRSSRTKRTSYASTQYYVQIAKSETLDIVHAKETPTSIHLALTNETSKMIVQFTTGHVAAAVPVARISGIAHESTIVEGTTDTYTSADLCQSPGNLTQAGMFYPPGLLHTIELDHLQPNTSYKYQVGLRHKNGTVLLWSDEYTFHTAPSDGDTQSFSYVVYGDQGCPHLGWKGGQEWLEAMVARETNLTSVHHFGDISYARGAAHVWDGWFQMVQPMTARVPLMVAIGNHEYDHTDGGGPDKDPSGVKTAHGYMPKCKCRYTYIGQWIPFH